MRLGYLPINKEDSNLFFQLTDMRYEKKSTILTTNMNFNEWDGVFYDAVVANAIMDRILHHAHVVPISGKSYRLKDHLRADRLIVHFYIIFFVHSVLTFYMFTSITISLKSVASFLNPRSDTIPSVSICFNCSI